jgi:DNA helicase IV
MEPATRQGASQDHLAWAEEQRHLGATTEAIGGAIERPLKANAGTGDEAALLAMEEHRAWRRIQLRQALPSPYFARIDFCPAPEGKPATYYIGKTFFEGGGVKITGWQTPVAALFYRAASRRASYLAPDGEIRGEVQLKRRLVIDGGELVRIADDHFGLPAGGRGTDPGAPPRAGYGHEMPVSNEQLRVVLSGRASPWLRDIITTIEPEQYALITAPADQILIVQGVAGSGKTSIALHRLSYLIYPSLVSGRVPPRCVVFGPNRMFLRYISAVLPKLGLQRVVQTTLTEWALERMQLENVRLVDATFEALLDPAVSEELKETLYRRSRLKTSQRMGVLLERYVEWRRQQIAIPEEGWTVRQTIHSTLRSKRIEHHIPAGVLRARHGRFSGRPFVVHRALFVEGLVTYVNDLLEAQGESARIEAEAQMALGRRRLQQAAEQRMEVQRMRGTGSPQRVRFGAAPAFGAAPPTRSGVPSGSTDVPGSGSVSPGAMLRQTLRQLELSAERRQREGEALILNARASLASLLTPEELEQARKGARAEIERLADRNWPSIEPVRDYHALVDHHRVAADDRRLSPERLPELARGLLDADEVALLAEPARTPANTIDLSDLPAIHYLFVISQDPEKVGRAVHEHVVIDEAQDVAELDLHCLRLLERRQRFTLVGDLAQSIYSHRGLSSWAQVEQVFAGAPSVREECSVSYRTTAEITNLANRVLRSLSRGSLAPRLLSSGGELGGPLPSARAFERHGPLPSLVQVKDEAALLEAVSRAIAAARARGALNVAVIAKTSERARDMAARLTRISTDRVHGAGVRTPAAVTGIFDSETALAGPAASPDIDYRGGVVALPVHLAKGLEFDAAVVVDADAQTYASTSFDGRLLYVALTRALHELHVVWVGQLTSHLQAVAE